jgi:hypothetical protein
MIKTFLVPARLRWGVGAEQMPLKRGELSELERLDSEGLSACELSEECLSGKHI